MELDELHRKAAVEVLTLLTGAFVQEWLRKRPLSPLSIRDTWDTFVVDFYTEGVSASDFVKRCE